MPKNPNKPLKIRKANRKVIKKERQRQRKLGAKLSSLRGILDKVSRGQMTPENAYRTISVSLIEEQPPEVEISEKENMIIMFLRKIFQKT